MHPFAARAHAFVTDLHAPELDPGDRHHLERVLRLRPGELVTVSDGGGRWRPCRWTGSAVDPDGDVVADPAPFPAVTVALALTKGERPEWAVQKLTELGVDRIQLFAAARSVVRWDRSRAGGHMQRLRRVAHEAAMQCRRTRLPEIAEVVTFAAVAASGGSRTVMAQRGGFAPSLDRPAVLIGPEGGWAPEELACGLPLVGLGPAVLRAETAAVAAAALLCGLRAGVVGPPPADA